MCEQNPNQINISTLVITGGDQTPSLVTEISGLDQNKVHKTIFSNSTIGKPYYKDSCYALVKGVDDPPLSLTKVKVKCFNVSFTKGLTEKNLEPVNTQP